MEYIKVGKVKDAHGLKGELFILLFAGEATWIDELNEFRLTRESSSGEIEIKKLSLKAVRPHKDGLILLTEEITDRSQAEALKAFQFEIPKELLVSESGETPYLIEVLGFEVYDQESLVGTIEDFSSNNEQDLLVVESPTHIYEIPFVEAYILDLDYDLKKIKMSLPEALLELCGYAK